jgi:hypothetical protein
VVVLLKDGKRLRRERPISVIQWAIHGDV